MSIGYCSPLSSGGETLQEQEWAERAKKAAQLKEAEQKMLKDRAEADKAAAREGEGMCPALERGEGVWISPLDGGQWLPAYPAAPVEPWAQEIRSAQWAEIFQLADDVALAKGAWGMAEHIERLRTERPEKGQGRRNWDCAAQAVSRKAAEMREECAASERRKDETEAEERRRLENNPFAALAALKRGTK